jgi:hypothetical protein
MDLDKQVPFRFHAGGHAFSAQFHRPVPLFVEAQASASLPTIGGHARARVENFRAHHIVSFRSAHTHVSGSWEDHDTVTTNSTTTIEGLNILDVITADRIVARLSAVYKRGQASKRESHIVAVGSHFDNLRIAGHEVKVILRHDLFLKCPAYSDLLSYIARDKESGKKSGTEGEVAVCSLVEKIETDIPGLVRDGHILHVPHFGEISVAEVLAVPGTRTLTMLQLKLGSPDCGLGTVCEAMNEGQPPPPPFGKP